MQWRPSKGPMEALHARYPFLEAARQAVETAEVDLAEIAQSEGPVVERAIDRITTAIETGRIGAPHRSTRIELLSYPLARVLVSLTEDQGLLKHYADAEARTAFERFTSDFDDSNDFRSVSPERLTLTDLLSEFSLTDAVTVREDSAAVRVTTYLDLTTSLEGTQWRLSTRHLDNGRVHVTQAELYQLLETAARNRIESSLPLSVPPQIAEALTDHVEDIRTHLADFDVARNFDTVDPDLFPPCMKALESQATGALPPHSQFSLIAFYIATGMEPEAIVDRLPGIDADHVRSHIAHLRDTNGIVYPPPSCQTMVEYGDCVNKDALCEHITHPLEYYEQRLNGAAPEDYMSSPESQ